MDRGQRRPGLLPPAGVAIVGGGRVLGQQGFEFGQPRPRRIERLAADRLHPFDHRTGSVAGEPGEALGQAIVGVEVFGLECERLPVFGHRPAERLLAGRLLLDHAAAEDRVGQTVANDVVPAEVKPA